ncbi:MAG: GNAT family N-acetyltransferase, partial [Planctomycetales bacterium]|nr:GNAT family N-acetyltransferase [Planctomycetales bacterium]
SGSAEYWDGVSPYGYAGPVVGGPRGSNASRKIFLSRAFPELLQEMRERQIIASFLRLHPLLPIPRIPMLSFQDHGPTVYVDLQLSAEELERQTRPRFRTYIRKAREAGMVTVRDRSWKQRESFTRLYYQTMRRVGARPEYFFPSSYFEHMAGELRDVFSLFTVLADGEVVAAAVFSEYEGIVQYHLGAGLGEGAYEHASKLLISDVCRWAKERGNRLLHLGGGLGSAEDSLFQFKAGFSRNRASFATSRLIAHPAAYADCVERWSASVAADVCQGTGFFPAYRSPLPTAAEAA